MPRLPVHGISQDSAAATREFAKTFGLTFPMLLDSAGAHYPAKRRLAHHKRAFAVPDYRGPSDGIDAARILAEGS